MGLGFFLGALAGPQTGADARTGGLKLQALYGKAWTGNWFRDRFRRAGVLRYDPARAQPGYTLYTLPADLSAHLIDMEGHEVYRWRVPKDEAIPEANGARTLFGLLQPQVEGGHLFPNGDMILVYEVKALNFFATPLVKFDKNSHVLWRTKAIAHHAIDVVNDKIYALNNTFQQLPPKLAVPNLLGLPFIDEGVSVLDANGAELSSHSILKAMENANIGIADEVLASYSIAPLHSNSIEVLTAQTAPFIPGAKPGNVLLSLRNLDMLVVMDLENDKIIWALRGGWRKQHDAKMLPNGHILLFDNQGGLMQHSPSRVLEIDPNTGGIVWSYEGTEDDPLDSAENRGGAQRLANGNTLINEADSGRLLEVTPDGSVVWEYVVPVSAVESGQRLIATFGLDVTRCDPSDVSFLDDKELPQRSP